MTGKGCFVRTNHSGNSDEWRRCASLCRKLFHLRQRISFCCGKAKKRCLPMLRLGFRSSAKKTTKKTNISTYFCVHRPVPVCPLQSARPHVLAEKLKAWMLTTLPLFKVWSCRCLGKQVKWKGLSLNSHFWRQLARLALFLFVLLFLCFVVWWKIPD